MNVTNAIYILLWLTSSGCSHAGSAGIVANLEMESKLNPISSGPSGIGLAQWAGVRKTRLLSRLGNSWREMDRQLEYLVLEAKELGIWDQVCRSSNTASYAARFWMRKFERPRAKSSKAREKLATELERTLK